MAAQNADVVTSSFIFVSFHPTPNFLLIAFVGEGGNSILIVKKVIPCLAVTIIDWNNL